jgi:hypothetical protein
VLVSLVLYFSPAPPAALVRTPRVEGPREVTVRVSGSRPNPSTRRQAVAQESGLGHRESNFLCVATQKDGAQPVGFRT